MFEMFPREFGKSRILVYNMDEFVELINLYNGKADCYTTLYNYNRELGAQNQQTVEVDKIFFDFDEEGCIEDVRRLHKGLLKENKKHIIFFSGRGFHVYIFCKVYNLSYPRSAVKNAQLTYILRLGIGVDDKVIGDIARLARLPNTWNPRRQRFCIPVSSEDLEKGIEFIREKAKKQNFKYDFYGEELLDMKKYDHINEEDAAKIALLKEIPKEGISTNLEFPECIKKALAKPDLGYDERYSVILFCRDGLHLFVNETVDILQKYLSQSKFEHCMREAPRKYGQVSYLYERPTLFFNCDKMKRMGYCSLRGKCDIIKGVYK